MAQESSSHDLATRTLQDCQALEVGRNAVAASTSRQGASNEAFNAALGSAVLTAVATDRQTDVAPPPRPGDHLGGAR